MISTSKLGGTHDSSLEKKKYPLAEAALVCENEGKQISPDTVSWRENQTVDELSLDHPLH